MFIYSIALLYSFHEIIYILIADIQPSRQTHAYYEQRLGNTVDIRRHALVARLLVYWLPHWASLDTCCTHYHSQGLDIIIGLAIGGCRIGHVDDAGSTAYCAFDNCLVGIFLALDAHFRIDGNGAGPVITIIRSQ